jgi:hypothetical protein
MRTKYLSALVLLLLVIATAAIWKFTEPDGVGANVARVTGPVLVCPGTVELGEAESGDAVTGTFEMRNTGNQPLEISGVRTACVCIGLQRKTASGLETVQTTTLAPGESAEFQLRFNAVGPAGLPFRVSVLFQTNDPEHPEHGVQFLLSRIRGGVIAYPAQLLLSGVTNTKPTTRRLDVYDTGEATRAVRAVRVVGLGSSTCAIRPPDPASVLEERKLGRLIGHLDLTVTGMELGQVRGRLEVTLDDPAERVLSVPVIGDVLNLVRIAPSAMVLPMRRSGEWSYTARCLCRPTEGDELKLELTDVPAALDVKIIPPTEDSPTYLEVTVKPEFQTPASLKTHLLKLKGRVHEQTTELEIPVSVSAISK